MLSPTLLGRLDCAAASGLFADATRLMVVADDDTRLHVYARGSLAPLGTVALFPDALPSAHRERKAAKPDLEVLTSLGGGRLLALGSGSTPRRRRGALIRLPAEDVPTAGDVCTLDLAPLYAALDGRFPALNIEGAALIGGVLHVLQRGNGTDGQNALVHLDFAAVEAALSGSGVFGADLLLGVTEVALGGLPGGALGFTDAWALPDGDLLYTAVAEGGGSTYEDGAFGGAVLGRMSPRGEIRWRREMTGGHKVEGLCGLRTEREGTELNLLLVADADDPSVPAPVLALTLSAASLAG